MNIFSIIKRLWKKPKVVIITGNGKKAALEAISEVLKPHFRISKDVLVFETDFKNPADFKKYQFLMKKSELPVLVVTHFGEIPADRISFSGKEEETTEIREFIKNLPAKRRLIFNFDDDAVRILKKENLANSLTFGYQEGADFMCSDIKVNGETNFKVNYDGKTVPFWLDKPADKEKIYSILSASAVGTVFNLNLVEISQSLKGVDICNKLG